MPRYPLPEGLHFTTSNQIRMLVVDHPKVKAKISLQGAQLLSWQPAGCEQDVLWLSEIEPFSLGNAIRGGVPICYPWFGTTKSPAHGYARNRLWSLSHYQINENAVSLEFSLYDETHRCEAKVAMTFDETCQLTFTHLGNEPAQVAFHSYFNLSHIDNAMLQGLPNRCFDQLTSQEQEVDSPRKITENVDCIYTATPEPTVIADSGFAREIVISHQNASEVVVWNPWHKPTGNMSENGYETMVCVESARIHQLLQSNEQVSVKLSVNQS
ncbi:D-hexose-6-phosphate mutarotase [Pasteurellaceae bacterium Macca]|nr:D-hexose-6-phosphate mutarotase [Pasteurellaceae bacterium Macca]